MKQVFIKDTNKQYSIREDGVVISHWRNHNKGGISYKERILKPNLNNNTGVLTVTMNKTLYTVKKLVMEYFYIGDKYTNIIHIDNNPRNCHLDNLKYVPILNHTEYMKGYRENPSNKEHLLETDRKSQKKAIDRISKSYVAHLMRLSVKDIDDDLYNLYKAKLQLTRLIKTKQNVQTN